MPIELVEIPGLETQHQTEWKVRALVVDGRDPVRAALIRWKREYPDDYKAIMKAMRMAGQQYRLHNQKLVKKSTDANHGNAYEFIAYTGVARLMFFYDKSSESLIVCTNEFEKSRGDQSDAFLLSTQLRELYFNTKTTTENENDE